MPKSIECNISMQMSSTENADKENRGLTLILARCGSPAAPMCGTGTYSLPRGSRCRSKECHRSPLCASGTFPRTYDEALCQAQAPQSLLLATTSSCVGAKPLRLVAPRRWPRLHQKAPLYTSRKVDNGIHGAPASTSAPAEAFCSEVTRGVSNTSFSWCQCCFNVSSVLLQCCSVLEPRLYHNSPHVLLYPSEQEAFGAVGAQHFWCATPPPWRPKPSVKSTLVPCLAQKLRLTLAKENTFPTFFSTRLASTSCSKRKAHYVGVSAAPAPKSRQFEAGRHQAERNCLATAADTSDMKPVLTTNRQRQATGRR